MRGRKKERGEGEGIESSKKTPALQATQNANEKHTKKNRLPRKLRPRLIVELFSRRIEHIGFSKLIQANLTETGGHAGQPFANRALKQQRRRRRRLRKRHLKSISALPQTLSRLFHLF